MKTLKEIVSELEIRFRIKCMTLNSVFIEFNENMIRNHLTFYIFNLSI